MIIQNNNITYIGINYKKFGRKKIFSYFCKSCRCGWVEKVEKVEKVENDD